MAQAATLSERDLKRALNFCATRRYAERDRAVILTSVYAGLRAKELAALNWGDVYDEQGAPRSQFTLTAAQTKGHRSRTVYVSSGLRHTLKRYAGTQFTLASQTVGDFRRSPLFRSQRNSRFNANTMCQLLLDIYKGCGLSTASSHSGRRTFITRLAAQGVSVRVLAELAGHSSIQTTQRYIDVNAEQMARAVELV
ncbi:tyrosine-type recombinase/integrase [Roseicyclus sp.]